MNKRLLKDTRRTLQRWLRFSLLIALFCLGVEHMQAVHYLYKQITPNNSLPSMVNGIFVDSKGFVWTATKSGLGRFDGYNHQRYTHSSGDIHSIPGNNIYQVFEDKHHHLWVLTNMGVASYQYRSNEFIPLDEKNDSMVAYSVCEWGEKLLFGSSNKVYEYDEQTRQLKTLVEINASAPIEINKMIVLDASTLLCSSRWQGIRLIDLRTKKITSPFHCGKEIMDVFVDKNRNIWIAPYNQGLQCYSPNLKLISTYTTKNSALSNDITLSITERKGLLWVATDGGGINLIHPQSRQITYLKHIPGDKLYSPPTNSINYLYKDSYNNIWVGGVYNGVTSIREVSMKSYTDVSWDNHLGLSHNIVLCLYRQTPDKIWIGTDGGGINLFNPLTEDFTHFASTREDKITSVCEFTPGKLLYSAFSDGIYVFDMQSGRKTPFPVIDKKTTETLSKHGYSVYLYRNTPNSILLLSNHVYIYNIQTQTFSIAEEERKNTIVWGTLQAITSTKDVTYLFDSKHIYTLDHYNNRLSILFSSNSEMSINTVSYDNAQTFWIGSNQGLHHFQPQAGKLTPIHTNLFNDVSSVVCTHNEIWVGAENKLFAYIPHDKRFVIYGESDGVIANEYIPRAQLTMPDGGVYMGGVKGLLYIAGNRPKQTTTDLPDIQLADVVLNGESVDTRSQKGGDRLTIPWDSHLALRIMMKEEDIFRNKLYRFRLEGLDNSSIESYDPEFIVRSLRQGTYRIMVSCTDKNGFWIPEKEILTLTVSPPWYFTWWFTTAWVLLLVALLIFFTRRALVRKEQKLKWAMKEHEQQVYEEKVRFLINISHELRTPLTLIYAPLKRILSNLSPENEHYKSLRTIYRQSKRMKSLINTVLDVRKMEVGQSKLQLQSYPFNQWIAHIAQDFVNDGDSEQTQIKLHFDEQIGVLSFDKSKCEIILSNLLINALKHSPQGSTITVTSELLPKKDFVRVSVSDEGCGLQHIDADKLFTRFYQAVGEQGGSGIGLSYSKILAEQHGGTIGAKNNDTIGATFYFELPYQQEEKEIICEPKAYLNELLKKDDSQIAALPEVFDLSAYKILVVDDNPDLTEFLKSTLQESFKQVITAADGVEALQLTRSHLPDIIVSDVMMPRMDGYEFCMHLKEDLSISHIPIILLTARDDEQSQTLGYKNGADGYLGKPFEVETLLALIRNRLKNRESIRKQYMNTGPVPIPEENTFSQADETFLLKMNKIVQDNLDNSTLDIAFICKEIGMSRASVYNKLKALTDMSANEYVNKFRMEKAIELITTTDMVFSEIAEQVGFTTSSYFSTAFKQYTGETPTQYKKRIRTKVD